MRRIDQVPEFKNRELYGIVAGNMMGKGVSYAIS